MPRRKPEPPISTADFAARLGVHPSRVRQLIMEGVLAPAGKFAGRTMLDPADLERPEVRDRRPIGRPRKNPEKKTD